VDRPHVFVYDATDSEQDAAAALAKHLSSLMIESPLVVCSGHGWNLAGPLGGETIQIPPGADQHWSIEAGARAATLGAHAIIAIGGGRCIDLGKLAAARAGVTLVTVPTQLSHDGICSPVAVVPNALGQTESLGALPPRAVFLSLPTLARAPTASLRAGIGDLLANPLALQDWALAAERGLENINEEAWQLSAKSYQLIRQHLEADPKDWARDARHLLRLADALILSGLAMIAAGTSRPASGAEHEISHAIDALMGPRVLHGAQVAFGGIVSSALRGDDVAAYRARLRRLGLPEVPWDLDMDEDTLAKVIVAAPETRPGRFTILEDANLDEEGARRVVREIWGTDR
jgi:glycerol-1-phosphate dehydrogenase [NAD(P)+]